MLSRWVCESQGECAEALSSHLLHCDWREKPGENFGNNLGRGGRPVESFHAGGLAQLAIEWKHFSHPVETIFLVDAGY
jgi:hypothetical protein